MFIVEKDPQSIAAESYRTLRTNIEYSSFNKDLKTIAITSSILGEGKTTTAGNLALALANDGKKVILVDCNLRKPTINKGFKISNGEGLSEVLIGKSSLEDVTREVSKGLDVITSGIVPPNPSEMLGSKVMEIILSELRETYDYVILDTPPLLVVTDGQILSTKVDGTILVVRAGKTKKDNVINAKGLLDKVGANIIGTVLNGTEIADDEYNSYEKEDVKNTKRARKKKVSLSFGG